MLFYMFVQQKQLLAGQWFQFQANSFLQVPIAGSRVIKGWDCCSAEWAGIFEIWSVKEYFINCWKFFLKAA